MLAVEGEQPEWWLWDSHVASDAEARASSWRDVERAIEFTSRLLTYGYP